MFCGFVDPLSLFVGSKNETVFWPPKRAHFTSWSDFLTGRPKGEAGKWAHFWVVWSPKMRPCQVPSVAHLAHGSSPIFGCHRGQTSGSAVVQHVTIPNLLT